VSQFHHELNSRIAETQDDLARASDAGDEYLVGVRLGELESLARVAAEHGVEVAGVEESLARHGLTTPVMGLPLMVDQREAEITAARRSARQEAQEAQETDPAMCQD
jgi:hypothetical protein